MTDDTAAQIDALANAMSTMPGLDDTKPRAVVSAPARLRWAKELVEKWGVSIDPSKATVEVQSISPYGPHGPREVRERTGGLEDKAAEFAATQRYVETRGPAFLRANQPDLAERLRNAKTPAQRQALQDELRKKIDADPSSLISGVLKLVAGLEGSEGS